MKNIHQFYMQQALTLAKRGKLTVSPNPMVGCLIVKNGRIIAEGWHTEPGKPHAEIYALETAGLEAKGATVYVTLEPCCHKGRTGPCTDALIAAKVKEVIIATIDPNLKVAGKGVVKLKEAGIKVKLGVLEDKAKDLNKIFFYFQQKGMPFVYAKWAMSLDGKTSTNGNNSKKISSEKAFIKTHRLRNICDAILIGKQTLLEDNPSLDVRININKYKNPIRFILFSKLDKIDYKWKVLNQEISKTIFICTSITDQIKDKLSQLKIEYWIISEKNGKANLQELLGKMGNFSITSLLIEGGMNTLENFCNEELVNEFITYLCPVLIAKYSNKRPSSFNKIRKLGNDLVINSTFKEQVDV